MAADNRSIAAFIIETNKTRMNSLNVRVVKVRAKENAICNNTEGA